MGPAVATERLVARVPGDVANDLRRLASESDRSLAGTIRHALRAYVLNERGPAVTGPRDNSAGQGRDEEL